MDVRDDLIGVLDAFRKVKEPPGSIYTSEWLQFDRLQHAALGHLWEKLRARHQSICEKLELPATDIEGDMRCLSADQDPEHIISVMQLRDEILNRLSSKPPASSRGKQRVCKAAPSLASPSLPLQTKWGSEENSSSSRIEKKSKIKTRSSTFQEPSQEEEEEEEEIKEVEQIKCQVSKRGLPILSSMLNPRERKGGCGWIPFVQAMAEANFVAHQGHGSEVQFEPSPSSKWFGMGKIVFHRPHPNSFIDQVKLASFGYRMRKRFGWNEGTFSLKE